MTDETRVALGRKAAAAELPKHTRLIRSGRDWKILSAVMRPCYVFGVPPGHAS